MHFTAFEVGLCFASLSPRFVLTWSSLPYIPPPPGSPKLLDFLRDTSMPKLAFSTYIGWYEDGGLNESTLMDQVEAMATKLRPHGWTHILHDYNWQLCGTTYKLHLIAQNGNPGCIHLDQYGRPLPSPQRYPSTYKPGKAGDWKPLVDAVHAKGIAYGLHLIHGIPKEAVEKRLPILGTEFTADELVAEPRCDTFIADNWRMNTKHPGAQAYYDSLIQMWAEQGIDFIYFDGVVGERCGCHLDSVRLMSNSLRNFGNGMFFFTSYGPPDEATCPFKALSQYAPYIRIGSDTEDRWEGSIENGFSQFTRHVAPLIGPHRFGDLAALMVGKVHCRLDVAGCSPGPNYYVPSARSKLTKDEVISYGSMIAMFRSSWWPSGVLSEMDDFMQALLTNDAVIRITMMSNGTRQVRDARSLSFDGPGIVWTAQDSEENWKYVLLVNMCPCSAQNVCHRACNEYNVKENYSVEVNFADLGLKSCKVTDLWRNKSLGTYVGSLEANLRPHASLLVRLSDCSHTSESFLAGSYEALRVRFSMVASQSFDIWAPSSMTLIGIAITFSLGVLAGRLCRARRKDHVHGH